MKLFIHVRLFNIRIDQVKNDHVGDVDYEEQFKERITLRQYGRALLLKP